MLTIFHMLNGDLDILCSETPIPIFCPVNIKLSILKSGFIVLYILDVSFLSDTFIVDNFYSVACFVFLLLVYFYEGMLWILEKGNLSIFLSVKVVRYLPVPVLEIYSPIFFFLEVFLVLTFIFGLWSILNFFFYMLSVWSKKGIKITSFFSYRMPNDQASFTERVPLLQIRFLYVCQFVDSLFGSTGLFSIS